MWVAPREFASPRCCHVCHLAIIVRNRLESVMREPLVNRLISTSQLLAALICLTILNFGGRTQAQVLRFAVPPAPPQVDVISGPTAAQLEQAKSLIAHKNWTEAFNLLRELTNKDTDSVVAVGDRFIGLPAYSQLLISHLPPEALAEYRRTADPIAERWYRDGVATRDEQMLRRVLDEQFCSSWGDDTLLALGELSLERGDYEGARRAWEEINPQLPDPTGKSMWLALRDIDLAANWAEIDRRWQYRPKPPDWLAFPDSELSLADLRARLALVSIRAGEFDRAALEIDVLNHFHPNAVGRLGGQEGLYAPALEKLLATARSWPAEPRDPNWPTFAGAPTRSPHAVQLGPVTGPAWKKAVDLVAPLVFASPQSKEEAASRHLNCFPVVVDGIVLFCDATQIHAVDLATGQPAFTKDGVLYRDEALDNDTPKPPGNFRSFRSAFGEGVPRYSMTVAGGIAYARLGQAATTRLDPRDAPPGDRLIGLDLTRDGLMAFRARPDDGRWAFDGVPLSDGHHAYVAMRRGDVTPHAYVACFDNASGRNVWRTAIGAADTLAGGRGDEITHNLLTLVGNRIYFNSNLGLIAAIDATNGQIDWLRRYGRLKGVAVAPGTPGPAHLDRDPSPCMFHEGLLLVAPSDTPNVFALDADTGETVWLSDQLADIKHLLGVAGPNFIVSGSRLRAVDVRTGKTRFVWPESENASIRGIGRGVLAGDEIFWPTRREIYVIQAVTGNRTRAPIDLASVSDCGANLVAANKRLVVAGPDKLMAFGAALPQPPDESGGKKSIAHISIRAQFPLSPVP